MLLFPVAGFMLHGGTDIGIGLIEIAVVNLIARHPHHFLPMLCINFHFLFLFQKRQCRPAPIREEKVYFRDMDKFSCLPWETYHYMVSCFLGNQLACNCNGIMFPGLVMVQKIQPLV